MPSKQHEQHDFSVGEISPDHLWRSELQIRGRSLKTARNVRLLVGGGARARPGTTWLASAAGDGQVVDVTVSNTAYMLVFTNARLDIYQKSTRALVQSFTGMTWNLDVIVQQMAVAPHGSKIFVFHQIRRPQVIERASSGTWSVTEYAFSTGIGGAKAQPYYRFAGPGVTLTPSALSGAITLTASAGYFLASGHVGLRFRLQGREVEITGYTSATVVSANVIQPLFPTKSVTVASSAGYEVGEIVQGQDSSAKGEVVAVPDATHITVLMHTFTDFFYSGTTGEKVVGRNAVALTTAAVSTTTNAAVLDWTEQAFSDVRGWPGTAVVHRARLFMGRLDLIPFGILASAVGDHHDFEVGAGDSDAIFEELGDEDTGIIQSFVSAEQLLVLTSKQAFYYPESEVNPIRPSSFQLLRIGPIGASSCRPALIPEGVLFGSKGGGSVVGAFPTGDVRRSWRAADMSRLSAHLIGSPRNIAFIDGAVAEDGTNETVSYAYAVNDDGTLAVLSYSETEADAIPGWVPWDTKGEVRWLAASEGECWALVKRTYVTAPTTRYTLEVFEEGRLVDCGVDVPAAALQGAASGQTIQTPAGAQAADFVYRAVELAGATVSLVIGGDYIGEVTLSAAGDFGVPDLAGQIVLGFGFTAEMTPWPPMDPEDQRARRRKRRISGALVRYQGKGIAVNGKLRPLFDGGEDSAAAAPERDELWRWPVFGWSQEPTVTISKPYAAPWTVLGFSLEVAS